MTSKRIILVLIVIFTVIIGLVLFFRVRKKTNTSNNNIKNSENNINENKILEMEKYNIDGIDSIYYVDPEYNPRFPSEN